MTLTVALLFLGVICAAVGGEIFVKGSVGLATSLRVPPAIVAATIAAFATSSPEISVAVLASVAKTPEIALGDALGSNVANLGLVLGLAALISAIPVAAGTFRREIGYAIAAPLITLLFVIDGQISTLEGLGMLVVFSVWIGLTIREAKRQRMPEDPENRIPIAKAVVLLVVGIAFLALSGRLVVLSATQIAEALGLSTVAIAATVVAAGTSMPELATTVMAKLRGHDDVAIGTLLGSNVFNNLFIVGVATTIHPITKLALHEVGLAIGVGVALVLILAWSSRRRVVCRWTGALLFGLYVAFVAGSLALAG